MRRLFPVLVQELNALICECVKWTLVGVLFFIGMWFMTDGVPRLVAVINGQRVAGVIHPATSERHPVNPR